MAANNGPNRLRRLMDRARGRSVQAGQRGAAAGARTAGFPDPDLHYNDPDEPLVEPIAEVRHEPAAQPQETTRIDPGYGLYAEPLADAEHQSMADAGETKGIDPEAGY
jgi:hypothetical protein